MSPLLLAHDGRLPDLTIDRLRVDDLSEAERAAVEAHLAAHPDEQARVDAVRVQLAVPLPPPAFLQQRAAPAPAPVPAAPADETTEERPMAEVIPLFSARRLWPALGGALAVAAAALLAIGLSDSGGPGPGGPVGGEFTVRGTAVDMAVVTADGRSSGSIHAGDRLMFEATPREDGHLLVLGVDGAGSVYPWHPSGDAAASVPVTAKTSVKPAVGLQVDATPGDERIVALLCAEPVRYADVRGALASAAELAGNDGPLPAVRRGCEQSVVVLRKEVP